MKDDKLYAIHIMECMEKVEKYTQGGKKKFLNSTIIQDATVRNLQLLAESTQRLSDGLKARHKEIEWVAISGFRNVVVHGYLGIDLEEIWHVVKNDLPPLKRKVKAILKQMGSAD